MQKLRIITLFLLITLVSISSLSVSAENEQASGIAVPDGYIQIAENDKLIMYLEESELNIAVFDRSTAAVYYTSPPNRENIEGLTGAGGLAAGSHLVVNYYDSTAQSTESVNSLLGSVRQKTAKYSRIANGIRIDYDFSRSKECFKIPITVTLTDTGICAKILFNEIEEYSEAFITDISLLPYFFSGTQSDNGYILIPDGSGAVIDFNTGETGCKPYHADVYGRDPALSMVKKDSQSENAMLPVFGIEKNGNSIISVVNKGAGTAAVNAAAAGTDSVLNSAYYSFTYRKADSILLADNSWMPKRIQFIANITSRLEEVEVCYTFLEHNGIAAMAEKYREHLIDDCGLKKDPVDSFNCFSLYGAFKVNKSFLGIPYEGISALTSFSQAQEIIDALKSDGITNQVVRYFGVLKGGMDDSVPVTAGFESSLGGNKGLRKLLENAEKNGCQIYPDIEFVRIAKSRLGWWQFNYAAKDVHRSPLTEAVFKRSVFYQDKTAKTVNYLDVSKIGKVADKFIKSSSGFDLSGLSVKSLSSIAYSSFSSEREYDEDGMIAEAVAAMKRIKEEKGGVITGGGNDYSSVIADHIFDVSVTDSGYDSSSYRVPFYQMVFSGYKNFSSTPLNMSSDYINHQLLCIETATAPSFDFTYEETDELVNSSYEFLYSTKFSTWKDLALEAYDKFNKTYSSISDRRITGYAVLQDDLRKTTFADGSVIYVNYSSRDLEAEGNVVKSKDFLLLGGD